MKTINLYKFLRFIALREEIEGTTETVSVTRG